jgi:hypothetical protein
MAAVHETLAQVGELSGQPIRGAHDEAGTALRPAGSRAACEPYREERIDEGQNGAGEAL